MLIFIDSNILCADFYLKSTSFEVIKKIGTIVLGQIVVDEVYNKYKEKLEEHLQRLKKEVIAINKMVDNPIDFITDNIMDAEIKKYREFLDIFSIENGMTIAESYPQISHEEVVKRALQRKKPFKVDGSTGYRDYLVWLTCLELAKTYTYEDIHFITNNINDFSDPHEKSKLHNDLLLDLDEYGIEKERFHYWSTLRSFIDEFAKSHAAQIDEYNILIKKIEDNKDGFQIPVQKYISSSIVGMNISGYDVFVPGEKPIIRRVEDFSDYSIENISKINTSEYLLEICINSIAIIESNIDFSELLEYEDFGFDIEVVEHENNDKCLIRTTLALKINLRAIYNIEKRNIITLELDDLDDYNCIYCNF